MLDQDDIKTMVDAYVDGINRHLDRAQVLTMLMSWLADQPLNEARRATLTPRVERLSRSIGLKITRDRESAVAIAGSGDESTLSELVRGARDLHQFTDLVPRLLRCVTDSSR